MVDEEKHNPHCAVRHSFIAVFSSRHLNTIKKPDSLQQWVKAEEEKHVNHSRADTVKPRWVSIYNKTQLIGQLLV